MKTMTACRYCGSPDLQEVISLGAQPPSNSFLTAAEVAAEERFPLEVIICRSCYLMQLRHVLPPHILFDRYLYLSSTSGALRRHYADLTRLLSDRFKISMGDVVVDIGCNDGTLLEAYDPRLVRIGVEPSQIAERARASGFVVFKGFFDRMIASQIISTFGHPKVVTATNVFPHVDDIHAFADAIRILLGPRGVFVIEASYLPDLVDQCLFDTVYHEHLCYLSLTPLVPFLQGHGLRVIDAERVAIGASGPAIRVYVVNATSMWQSAASVDALLGAEATWGVRDPATYAAFAARTRSTREQLLAYVADLRATGARVGGYGAPAKGNTLLNYVGFDRTTIEMIAETNELKHGLLTPGSHIPIVSETVFLEEKFPYSLLLSWNYLDYFLQNSPYVKAGGRFVVPLPRVALRP
jgi:hypothetical protein